MKNLLNIAVLFIFLVVPISGIAQRSPLVITGSITNVRVGGQVVAIPTIKDNKWVDVRWERKETLFEVSVHVQYCNRGDVTLIVPKRSFFQNERKKVLFLDLPSSDSKISASVSGVDFSREYQSSYDPMLRFLKELEKPEPSNDFFAIIEPWVCHSSGDWILIKSGYRLDERPGSHRFSQPISIAVPEHPYFKVQYSLDMKDSQPVSEAKRRWSKIGTLLTTSDGDFFLETEFIINRMPDQNL